MMLVKNTSLVEAGNSPEDDVSKIKIDIFILENIPDNMLYRYFKGTICCALMFIASNVDTYEKKNDTLKNYMCKTPEGEKAYKTRMKIGKLFSFMSFQKWMNLVDRACQYKKETKSMGIPTGRGHYFREIRSRETFIPASKGQFEGMNVNLPGNTDDYISNLYGKDYMTLPPIEKRERHFIVDIGFDE